jgi:hypothetical protein
VTTAGAYAMQSAYFFKSAAIVANCESAASKSSTMEIAGAGDMDGKPKRVIE